jgi:predicted PurR-regulated permease PerM
MDNVLRPVIFARGLKTPMLVIIVGVIGGTLSNGIIGLFVGPIVLAVAWDLLVAFVKDKDTASVQPDHRMNADRSARNSAVLDANR